MFVFYWLQTSVNLGLKQKTDYIMTRKVFDELLVNHRNFLEPFALSLTRDTEDAKDLIQETLFRAIANKEKFEEGTNIKGWLFTIMRNVFINSFRRNKKFKKVSSELPQEYFLDHTDRVAHNEGLINAGIREIKAAINRLPDIFRLSFELHYIGYKYQEIADAFDEPLGTIKSRIHFARKMLVNKLVC